MIIRFEVENFRSIREPVTLLLTPGKERQHAARLPRHPGTDERILPASAIYGPNASGKSNLIEAARMLQQLVVNGSQPGQPIHRQAFKLDPAAASQPTRFNLDFIAPDEKAYRYSLSVTEKEVHHEELSEVRRTVERLIFRRERGEKRFDVSGLEGLAKDKERRAFFRFAAEGTRPNQPFLHEAADRDIHELEPVLRWFSAGLIIIGPESRPITLEDLVMEHDSFRSFLRDRLRGADTGIHDIETEDRPLDEVTEIPAALREKIRAELKENDTRLFRTGRGQVQRFLVRYRDGEIRACQLRATRLLADGSSIAFDADDESDGTRRYMDLALAFYAVEEKDSRHVILVDELDRSLHPVLCRSALETFLSRCGEDTRSQLVITTHDVTLMTQELFRRDELWLMEKDLSGASRLFSLGDFTDLRNDKELRRNYLQGRFGGIPVVSNHRPHAGKTALA
jgi:AAA15 family ATPase/GTPase